MKFFKKLFGKKTEENKLDFAPLPIPKVKNKITNMSLGKLKIEEQIGELYQAMPNRRAQIWQVLDEEGNEDIIASVAPSEENQKWVESRLGEEGFRIKYWKTIKAEGAFRKFGTRLAILSFDTILENRYILKKRLVSDELFEVYKAWDEIDNTFVYCTVCVPQKSLRMPEELVERAFEVNNKRQKKKELLAHKPASILNVYNEGFCKPTGVLFPHRFKISHLYFTISEYCSDISFSSFVSAWRRHLPLENMLAILCQLTDMLLFMKKNSWVHGNIRPEHLWIGTEGEKQGKLFLNGFSLLKPDQNQQSMAYELLRNYGDHGTFLYMSPEQVSYESVDSRADQFCVGMILAEFVMGRHPFKSLSQRQISRKLQEKITITSDSQTPKWVLQLINRFLEINPDDRFLELADIFEEIKTKWQEMDLEATGDIISSSFEDMVATPRTAKSSTVAIIDEADPLAEENPQEDPLAEEKPQKVSSTTKKEQSAKEDAEEEFFEEEEEWVYEDVVSSDKPKVEKKDKKKKPVSFPKPVPKAKTFKTSVDTNKPKTSVDTKDAVKPKTSVDNNKSKVVQPKTSTDTKDIAKPKTSIDSNKSKVSIDNKNVVQPKTSIDTNKPKTSVDTKDIVKPKTSIDNSKSKVSINNKDIAKPKTFVDTKDIVKTKDKKEVAKPKYNVSDLDQFANEETAMMEILEKTSSFGLSDKIKIAEAKNDPLRMTATDEFTEDNYTEEDSKLFHELEDEDFEDWEFENDNDDEAEEEEESDWDVLESSGKKQNGQKKDE